MVFWGMVKDKTVPMVFPGMVKDKTVPMFFWGMVKDKTVPMFFWGTIKDKTVPMVFWGMVKDKTVPTVFWGMVKDKTVPMVFWGMVKDKKVSMVFWGMVKDKTMTMVFWGISTTASALPKMMYITQNECRVAVNAVQCCSYANNMTFSPPHWLWKITSLMLFWLTGMHTYVALHSFAFVWGFLTAFPRVKEAVHCNCESSNVCASEKDLSHWLCLSSVLKWLNHACLRSFNAVTEDVLPILPVVCIQTACVVTEAWKTPPFFCSHRSRVHLTFLVMEILLLSWLCIELSGIRIVC